MAKKSNLAPIETMAKEGARLAGTLEGMMTMTEAPEAFQLSREQIIQRIDEALKEYSEKTGIGR